MAREGGSRDYIYIYIYIYIYVEGGWEGEEVDFFYC